MRRAERLFQIIQLLRRSSGPTTAATIASEVEVSVRTVYRDIADLIGQRVPVVGEAGVGYLLRPGFDMPPLMLTPDELEAAALGAQFVQRQGDSALASAASDLLAKIAASVPQGLRSITEQPTIGPPDRDPVVSDRLDLAATRQWIREGRKIRLRYCDEAGRPTERTVWPVFIGYMERVRLLAAWCEVRQDFRHFRADRVLDAAFLDVRFPRSGAELRREWRATLLCPPASA